MLRKLHELIDTNRLHPKIVIFSKAGRRLSSNGRFDILLGKRPEVDFCDLKA